MHERLWAPWRYPYLKSLRQETGNDCIFCVKPEENKDKENLIVFRGDQTFVMMNKFPYNNGHLLIIPYRHLGELGTCNSEEQKELFEILTKSITIFRETMNPDGFNIGMNLGQAAGAGIADHIHFHIVPRWNGDTNYMPIVSDTRVISMSLEDGWELLHQKFNEVT